jgi:hypothetical protein
MWNSVEDYIVVTLMISSRLQWAWHIASMGETNTGKSPFGRPRKR